MKKVLSFDAVPIGSLFKKTVTNRTSIPPSLGIFLPSKQESGDEK